MEKTYYTKNLAELYEKQGYYNQALEHYTGLLKMNPEEKTAKDAAIEEAAKRLSDMIEQKDTLKLNEDGKQIDQAELKEAGINRLASLCHEWLRLLIARQKLTALKRISML